MGDVLTIAADQGIITEETRGPAGDEAAVEATAPDAGI
jgi:hypothetical protein